MQWNGLKHPASEDAKAPAAAQSLSKKQRQRQAWRKSQKQNTAATPLKGEQTQ
jgi:hypothetical protein